MKRLSIFAVAVIVLLTWYQISFSSFYVPVRAVFVSFLSKDHKRFEYLYVVSGATYTGTAFAGSKGNPATFRSGFELTAYYDTNHPANSTVNPAVLRHNKSIWILAIPGTIILLAITLWPEKRKHSQE